MIRHKPFLHARLSFRPSRRCSPPVRQLRPYNGPGPRPARQFIPGIKRSNPDGERERCHRGLEANRWHASRWRRLEDRQGVGRAHGDAGAGEKWFSTLYVRVTHGLRISGLEHEFG